MDNATRFGSDLLVAWSAYMVMFIGMTVGGMWLESKINKLKRLREDGGDQRRQPQQEHHEPSGVFADGLDDQARQPS